MCWWSGHGAFLIAQGGELLDLVAIIRFGVLGIDRGVSFGLAPGIEARRAETGSTQGSVHDSPAIGEAGRAPHCSLK